MTEVNPPSAYVVIDGPGFDGKIVPLKEGITTIGRLPANDIVLADGLVSRQHARISFFEDRATFQDLGSHNGSQVNSQTVSTRLLKGGDRIQLGSFQLSFRRGPMPNLPDPSTDRPAVPETRPSEFPLSALLLKVIDLAHAGAVDDPLDRALDLVESYFEAERVALIRRRWNGRLTVVKNRAHGPGDMARDVVEWVIQRRFPIALSNPSEDPRFAGAERTAPVACVPVAAEGLLLGALYLDRPRPAFTSADLDALMGCGHLVGVLLQKVELRRPPWALVQEDGLARSGLALAVEIQLPGANGSDTVPEDESVTASLWHDFLDGWVEVVGRHDGMVAGMEVGRVLAVFPDRTLDGADEVCTGLTQRVEPFRLRCGLAYGTVVTSSWTHQGTRIRFAHGTAVDGARRLVAQADWGELRAFRGPGQSRLPLGPVAGDPAILRADLTGLAPQEATQDVRIDR